MKKIDNLFCKLLLEEKQSSPKETYSQEDTSGKMAKGKTTSNGENSHFHEFSVNESGDGKTTSTEGDSSEDHEHEIKGFYLEPAGHDNHTHTIIEDPKELFKESKAPKSNINWDKFLGSEKLNEKKSKSSRIDWSKMIK